jgi:hypothetical protein
MKEIARLVPQSGREEDVLRIELCISTGQKMDHCLDIEFRDSTMPGRKWKGKGVT